MAELIEPGRKSRKEEVLIHHRFPNTSMVAHSLADLTRCPTCCEKKMAVSQAMENERRRLTPYLQHLHGCQIHMTEFCTCGLGGGRG